ncbi:hypothetical protein F2Q69_00005352 [Brassica cretica]|uniref:Uncharacterized protein n=1 Tax=Brassica cretica TaxID=69181 RepID=A0A8S9NUX6_BRACR|nr:hypothetical protein F2Q69_00005352 [Brassica cretica]
MRSSENKMVVPEFVVDLLRGGDNDVGSSHCQKRLNCKRSGGGLRTGASCSWNLEKRCNRLAMKGPPNLFVHS